MQSFLLFVNILLCSIILPHLFPNENGLANAMPTFNGGDELLLRKKRQDENEEKDAEDGANVDKEEANGEDNAGDEDENNAKKGNDGKNAEERENEENKNGEDNEEKEGDEKRKENVGGKQQKGGKKNGRGKNRGNENGGQNGNGQQQQQPPADGATCTDSAIGCDEAYCGITDFARAHCAGTCRSFLDECRQMVGVPDPSRACANTADNCGMNPNVCSENDLAVCGCPRKCGRCSDHSTYIMQGRCRNVL